MKNNPACIYWIRHPEHTDMLTQGYIGFTQKTLEHRVKKHVERSKSNKRKIVKLGAAIKKYGIENLVVQKLFIGSADYCLEIEYKMRPICGIGWNTGVGGSETILGRKATPEQRAHFSKVHSGRRHTEEWKKMMSEKFKGRKFRLGGKMPKEAIEKIRLAHLGSKRTDETKKKMSLAQKGKKRSIEARENISKSKRGKKQKPETIEKRAAALRGRIYPIVECPHYKKTGGKSAMLRHHFNTCRIIRSGL